MLILSRKIGESIIIGHVYTVTVRRVSLDDAQIRVTTTNKTWTYLMQLDDVVWLSNEQISIKLVGIGRRTVKLGITASRSVGVWREELLGGE